MWLSVVETRKSSLKAHFEITRGNQPVGFFDFKGWFGSDEGSASGEAFGCRFELSYARGKMRALLADDENRYEVQADGFGAGYARRSVVIYDSVERFDMQLGNYQFQCYPVARGRDGFFYLFFYGGRQVGEIRKECVVQDDLHRFSLAVSDSNFCMPLLAMCAYVFVQSWWWPGPAPVNHRETYMQETTDQQVLALFNPNYFSSVGYGE